jgi:hypothetical protein
MKIVLDNWPAKTMSVLIHAVHYLVVKMLSAFLKGTPLGVAAKVVGLRIKRLENVSANATE